MDNGFIKLSRDISNWEWFTDGNMLKVWIYVLTHCNWEDKNWNGIQIKKGTLITSVNHLSIATHLTSKQIRTCLKKLENTQELAIKTTNKYTQIIVNKWSEYQCCNDSNGKQKGKQRANKGQTKGKQRATTKELKELKELKDIYNNPYSLERDDEGNIINFKNWKGEKRWKQVS